MSFDALIIRQMDKIGEQAKEIERLREALSRIASDNSADPVGFASKILNLSVCATGIYEQLTPEQRERAKNVVLHPSVSEQRELKCHVGEPGCDCASADIGKTSVSGTESSDNDKRGIRP